MIPISSNVRVWIASGRCDMRKGMQGLALIVQEGLGRDPFKGDFFVFRGRTGPAPQTGDLLAKCRAPIPIAEGDQCKERDRTVGLGTVQRHFA